MRRAFLIRAVSARLHHPTTQNPEEKDTLVIHTQLL